MILTGRSTNLFLTDEDLKKLLADKQTELRDLKSNFYDVQYEQGEFSGGLNDPFWKSYHSMSDNEYQKYIDDLKKQKQKKEPEKDPLIRDIENRMSSKLGTKVSITGKTVNIQFTDTADLNRILELLGMLEETNG